MGIWWLKPVAEIYTVQVLSPTVLLANTKLIVTTT
mgnify:CR=1 FL=1